MLVDLLHLGDGLSTSVFIVLADRHAEGVEPEGYRDAATATPEERG